LPEAIKLVQEEIRRDPQQAQWPAMLAALYVRAERFDDAIPVYQQLVARFPKASIHMFRLGETYRRKGDLNAAIEWIRKASAESPNDPGILLQLGLLLEGTGKRDQARPLYEQVLKILPDEPTALNNLAFMKAEDGEDLDTALSMANKAREKRPKDPNIADTLGWVLVKKNLNDDAVRVLNEAVQADPKNPSYRYHFGVALMQKGDRPRGRQELEVALRNNPPRLEAEKIRTILASN
jgi:Flp pilus assembly protein TadD